MKFEYNYKSFLTIPESKAIKFINDVLPTWISSLTDIIKPTPFNELLNMTSGDG